MQLSRRRYPLELPMSAVLLAALLGLSAALVCPDGGMCEDKNTCCKNLEGGYGCCPLPHAECCSDHLHCCFEGTLCDLVHQKCVNKTASLPWVRRRPAKQAPPPPLKTLAFVPNDVVCPDRRTACPDETTCCQLSNGTYGCCPMPNAVCCSDHLHCCPAGTQCDLQHSACVPPRGAVSIFPPPAAAELDASHPPPAPFSAVACNDSVACADGSTCCKLAGGDWACCPLPKAVCCEDHRHCCPHGTVCNLAASTCDSGGAAIAPLFSKAPAFPTPSANSKCDKSTSCPGKSTCCRTLSGGWACCPLTQAVCCDDHVHCCPRGTVCNLAAQTCDDPSGSSPSRRWLEKTDAVTDRSLDQSLDRSLDEKCDKQTMCPGGTTCCKKDSGQWACCPLPQAVCCNDHEHCCPNGYKCNVAEQTCDKPDAPSLPWLQKTPGRTASAAVSAPPVRNMCDGRTSCPRGTTCCFMERSQEWGCCPLPDAVCCEDGNHCCPRGHVCEPHRSSCSRGPRSVPWSTKVSARAEPTDVKCDDKSSCASGATCCKLPTGEWGCCPLVKAVCCADQEHCCPQGYTCNMQTGTCEKKSDLALPQSRVVRPAGRRVPCDGAGDFHCSEEETCCRVSATEWGCCPSPAAGGRKPPAGLTWDSLSRHRKRHATL